MAARKKYDWEAIEKEYRLGQKSIRTIADQFECTHTTISRRAKREGWVQDKSEEVRQRTKAELLKSQKRTRERTKKRTTPTQDDINEAVQTNVVVIRGHQKLASRTIKLAERLLSEVEKAKTVELGAHGNLFRTIAQGLAKVIPLERQAFNIDDSNTDADKLVIVPAPISKPANSGIHEED